MSKKPPFRTPGSDRGQRFGGIADGLGRLAEASQEAATHAFAVPEPRFPRDNFDGQPPLLQHQARRFQTQILDSPGG